MNDCFRFIQKIFMLAHRFGLDGKNGTYNRCVMLLMNETPANDDVCITLDFADTYDLDGLFDKYLALLKPTFHGRVEKSRISVNCLCETSDDSDSEVWDTLRCSVCKQVARLSVYRVHAEPLFVAAEVTMEGEEWRKLANAKPELILRIANALAARPSFDCFRDA